MACNSCQKNTFGAVVTAYILIRYSQILRINISSYLQYFKDYQKMTDCCHKKQSQHSSIFKFKPKVFNLISWSFLGIKVHKKPVSKC